VEERFLYRGDGDGFLVHGEKRGGHRESAGDVFIPIRLFFFLLLGRDREAADVALLDDLGPTQMS
jgi:hypothetical protein